MNNRKENGRGNASKFEAAYEAISRGAEALVKSLARSNLAIKSKGLRIASEQGESAATFTLQVREAGTNKHFDVNMQGNSIRVKDLDAFPHPSTARSSARGYVFSTPVQALEYINAAIETKFSQP